VYVTNYQPKFSFTLPLINQLTVIERLYGQLLGEKLIPSLALKLSQDNQILATHHSTSIEGNPLSPKDVTNVILNDQIPTVKSEHEVKNYFSVLNTAFIMARKKMPLTTMLTEKLHHELMKDIEKKDLGTFRDGPVFVGHATKTEIVVKHNPPYHTRGEIKSALDDVYKWIDDGSDMVHPLLKAGVLHHQFAYIHPFFDGNGRLARILTAYYLLFKQYEVVRYFILDDYYDMDRQTYSDMLHSADDGDKTQWLEYFLEGVAYSLQASLARIQDLKRSSLEEVTGEKRVLVTPREEEVLQIVIDKKAIKMKDITDAFSVTRQQAHALLSSLVNKGLLEKFGSTKSSYYKLASQKTE
jgi:Fic family protein